MLHGEIKVNEQVIGEWTAVRIQEIDGFCDYDCHMTYTNMAGYPMEAAWTLRGHAMGNGAVSLAARVLSEGMQHLKVRPLPRDVEAVKEFGRRLAGG